jgi:hypothetical protein
VNRVDIHTCIEAAVMAFLEENLVLEIGLGTRLLSPSGLKGSWKAFSGFRHEEL